VLEPETKYEASVGQFKPVVVKCVVVKILSQSRLPLSHPCAWLQSSNQTSPAAPNYVLPFTLEVFNVTLRTKDKRESQHGCNPHYSYTVSMS